MNSTTDKTWRRPEVLLLMMACAVPLSFATWQTLIDNFAIHRAAFTGAEIGLLQSLREVPGFLAFAVIFLLLVMREQSVAFVALALLGIGTALTGWFPTVISGPISPRPFGSPAAEIVVLENTGNSSSFISYP